MKTITTVLDIDALPTGAVILDRDGDPWLRDTLGWTCADRSANTVDVPGANIVNIYGPVTVVHDPTAAAQPTTEPSAERHERVVAAINGVAWEDWTRSDYPETQRARCREVSAEQARQILAALAPAPQPAADTETEVQWGVRVENGQIVDWGDIEPPPGALFTGRTKVKHYRTRTPWEEA